MILGCFSLIFNWLLSGGFCDSIVGGCSGACLNFAVLCVLICLGLYGALICGLWLPGCGTLRLE